MWLLCLLLLLSFLLFIFKFVCLLIFFLYLFNGFQTNVITLNLVTDLKCLLPLGLLMILIMVWLMVLIDLDLDLNKTWCAYSVLRVTLNYFFREANFRFRLVLSLIFLWKIGRQFVLSSLVFFSVVIMRVASFGGDWKHSGRPFLASLRLDRLHCETLLLFLQFI